MEFDQKNCSKPDLTAQEREGRKEKQAQGRKTGSPEDKDSEVVKAARGQKEVGQRDG